MLRALVCGTAFFALAAPANALSISDFKLRQRGNRVHFTVDVCGRANRSIDMEFYFRRSGSRRSGSVTTRHLRLPYSCTDDMGYSFKLFDTTEGLWEGRIVVAQGERVRKTQWKDVFIR